MRLFQSREFVFDLVSCESLLAYSIICYSEYEMKSPVVAMH